MSYNGYTNIKTAQGDPTVDLSYRASGYDYKEYDPGFDKDSIWDQLGNILDSVGNPFPLDKIVTDDGVEFTGITPRDCLDIRNLALQFEKTDTRKEFLERIQQSESFNEVLEYVRKTG